MVKGGSITSDTTGDRPTAQESSSSLDSWFTGLAGSSDVNFSASLQNAAVHTLPPLEEVSSSSFQQQQQHQQLQPQTRNHSNSSSVISPALNQSLHDRLPAVAAALPVLMLPPANSGLYHQPVDAAAMPEPATGNSIPEFLYQLTKMLTDDNREIIEWSNGKIEVHSPHKLEAQVLEKYFRHSKFASFQRQLNYFGFRKLAGKGKMAPCSYMNDAATSDIGSLLLIKRKTSTSTSVKDKIGGKKQDAGVTSSKRPAVKVAKPSDVNPALAGILHRHQGSHPIAVTAAARNTVGSQIPLKLGSHQALARAAVGRGIRHGYSMNTGTRPSQPLQADDVQSTTVAQGTATAALSRASLSVQDSTDSLSELTNNYRSSLNELSSQDMADELLPTPLDQMRDSNNLSPNESGSFTGSGSFACFLPRDSSLIDLAMIDNVDMDGQQSDFQALGMSFVDFPNPEVYPSTGDEPENRNGINFD